MKSLHIAVGGLFLARSAFADFWEPPPTTANPNTIEDCTWWHVAATGDTCPSIAGSYGITTTQFTTYNPSLSPTCTLIIGNSYCIEQNYGLPPPVTTSTTTTTTSAPATTTTGNGVSTPTPIQDGMVANCNAFHFVVSGDGCTSIGSRYGKTLAQLYAWNPAIGSTCTGLWLSTYLCVGVIGGTTTTTATATTTTGNGVATPTPIQEGMVTNCNAFHFVVSGDGCTSIGSTYGKTLAQLYAWNPAIGSTCTGLWLSTYLCVGVIGGATTTTASTTSTTTTGNGITTPTPYRPGIPTNCNQFHFVVSGNQCGTIASTYGIPLSQFYTWNPAVGNACQSLWLSEYVCVKTVGYVAPTTTTTAGGIATPTPWQPGMATNCNRFHKVVSGNSCATIAAQYSITLTNFYAWNTGVGNACQTLWLDYYVCVGRT